jgi:hypothetical protein
MVLLKSYTYEHVERVCEPLDIAAHHLRRAGPVRPNISLT